MDRFVLSLCCIIVVCNGNIINLNVYKDVIIQQHNEFRTTEYAASMNRLAWSDRLANEAAHWVDKCRFEHENGGRGENIFFSNYKQNTRDLILAGLDDWHEERSTWRWTNGDCGFACHYTQMIWGNTTRVGCAAKQCGLLYDKGRLVKNTFFMACYYDPKGNIMGFYPFEIGPSCTKCPAGFKCDRLLCKSVYDMPTKTLAPKSRISTEKPMISTEKPRISTEKPRTTTPPAPSKTPSSTAACTDRLDSCKSWKRSCSTNQAVRISCPKTCNQCNPWAQPQNLQATSVPCEDDKKYVSSCNYWAKLNYCKHNQLMREVYCIKTCKTCY
ncbi:hypothetical protein SNE40_004841 [Patella caerulea]